MSNKLSRRRFLCNSALGGSSLLAARVLPGAVFSAGIAPAFAQANRPTMPYGVASGDIMADRAIVWSRSDRAARMIVEYATSDSFKNAQRVIGPAALETTDFTARVDLSNLPAGQDIFYRVMFQDLEDINVMSEAMTGHFRTAPGGKRDITFQWSGDTAGQGWGINEDWGGMKIYETMRQASPDFFIHCGDTIYADGPIEAEKKQPDGTIWKNLTIEEKSKVAETLKEFRANYAYNLMDKNVRAFNSEVPVISQWDDHEVTDNWYPQEILASDDRYKVKSVALLSARARRAFLDYMPVRFNPADPERIYRTISYGPSLDVFVIDMRSYRGPNGANNQETMSADSEFLGSSQVQWLKQALLSSTATWKVIASDMPIGIVVYDDWRNKENSENLANGDGPARGRELEMAALLSFIKHNDINNVVWLTADVHYTAAHYYDPDKAQYQDFAAFWEFVSGPLNAGTFGPNDMDNTFGPQVMFQKTPPKGQFDLPPSAGLQFYGEVKISGDTEVMTVMLKDLSGSTLYSVDLDPIV